MAHGLSFDIPSALGDVSDMEWPSTMNSSFPSTSTWAGATEIGVVGKDESLYSSHQFGLGSSLFGQPGRTGSITDDSDSFFVGPMREPLSVEPPEALEEDDEDDDDDDDDEEDDVLMDLDGDFSMEDPEPSLRDQVLMNYYIQKSQGAFRDGLVSYGYVNAVNPRDLMNIGDSADLKEEAPLLMLSNEDDDVYSKQWAVSSNASTPSVASRASSLSSMTSVSDDEEHHVQRIVRDVAVSPPVPELMNTAASADAPEPAKKRRQYVTRGVRAIQGPGSFHCEVVVGGKSCGQVFTRPYDLTRHHDTIHNRRTYRCDICGDVSKTFSRQDALSRHLRTKHA